MANMSYCKFENTLEDLNECLYDLKNRQISNEREKTKAKTLIQEIAEFIKNEDIISENCIDYERIDKLIDNCIINEDD